MRLLVLVSALAATAAAQQPSGDKPPPPPSRPDGPPPHREGDRRGPSGGPQGGAGMMPGMGGKPRGWDGFEKLSEEERAKVRAAFDKAWQRPEVIESRDKAMRANEEMRERLRKALQEIDPEVAKILEKVKPPFPMDQRGLPEMPKPESPEFGRMAMMRLAAEMIAMARPERREETRRFHDRIMQMPRLKEALAKLDQLPPEQRIDAFKKLRETYREVVGQEFAKLRERAAEPREGREGGFRRPPEGGKPLEPEKK
ncbi:MAG: hypothetical protein IAE77_08285 [Prosthecobacter sp.]|uniref:hypothetical protein n=1 Tax=Prosthecobacter sp. TaxID=1965333 RepID=UPI0019F9440B|nr:hypothetical protein [Prosthecobacter sp.]MBE2283446.1 hypothetical protein [Prosthecobacter sp.]